MASPIYELSLNSMHLYNFTETFVNVMIFLVKDPHKSRVSYFLTMAKKKKRSTSVVKDAANRSNPEAGIRK